mgnify:CR=1 FL=1
MIRPSDPANYNKLRDLVPADRWMEYGSSVLAELPADHLVLQSAIADVLNEIENADHLPVPGWPSGL